jgi:hypothetical protein
MKKFQKELKDRVTIKSVKTMNGREGMAINCNVFLDNKKVAIYHNSGNGGEGMLDAIAVKGDWKPNREKIKEIEKLISKLPKVKSDLNEHFLDIDIDWVIEELVEYSKFEKLMKKAILFGKDEKSNVFGLSFPMEYQIIRFKGINDLAKLNPVQLKNEVEKIKKELQKDEIIFNTNLPKYLKKTRKKTILKKK